MSVEVFDLSAMSDHELLSHEGAAHLSELCAFLKAQKPNSIAVLRISDGYRGGGFPALDAAWIEQYSEGLGCFLAALEDLNTCAAHTYFVVPSECVGLAWIFGLYAGVRLQQPLGVVGVGYSGVVRSALLPLLPKKLTGRAVKLVHALDASLHDPVVLPVLPLGYWRTIEFLEGEVLFETRSEPLNVRRSGEHFELTRARHDFLRLMLQKEFEAYELPQPTRVAFEVKGTDAMAMGCLADFLRFGARLEIRASVDDWKQIHNHFASDRGHLSVRFRENCLRCDTFIEPTYYDVMVSSHADHTLSVNGVFCVRIAAGQYEWSTGRPPDANLPWRCFETSEWFPLSERVRKVFWGAVEIFLEHYDLDRTRSERYLERDGWRVPLASPSNIDTQGLCDDIDWLAIAKHLRSGHLAMYASIILDEIMQSLNRSQIFESEGMCTQFLTAIFFVVPGFYPRPLSPERQYLLKQCRRGGCV